MNQSYSSSNLEFIEKNYFKKTLDQYIQHVLSLNLKIKGILLFGSVATGKARYDEEYWSDIDLMLICEDLPEDRWERMKKINDLTAQVRSGIQDMWLTPKEIEQQVESKFYLILDVFEEGKILYDPESLLTNLKRKLFKDLKKKGVVKTELYWRWPIHKFGDKIEY